MSVLQVRADEKALQFDFRIQGRIPSVIKSDPTRLRQVLINLVGNAVKFCQQGKVEVICRLEGEHRIRFDVVDTGIGMDAEQITHIFDPFRQANSSVTRQFGGTGLGLSISKRFVEALNGEIVVHSAMGAGSTFSVLLPCHAAEGCDLIDQEHAMTLIANRRQQGKQTQNCKIRPAKVLLVDDGETNRNLVRIVLTRLGLEVEEAENGELAVAQALAGDFDLVLMDMQMPVMDGYTAATLLREQGFDRPIIALTANAMQGDEERCQEAGCSGYLTKPIDMDRMIGVLGEKLGFDESSGQGLPDIGSAADVPPSRPVPSDAPSFPAAEEKESVLRSTLPIDDPEFRSIVCQFVEMIDEKLLQMELTCEQQQGEALADLAHWLKGSGGTVGFAEFTAPARQLEEAAQQGDFSRARCLVEELRALAARMEHPEQSAGLLSVASA